MKLIDERINFLGEIIKSAIARGNNRGEIFLDNALKLFSNPIESIFNIGRGIFGNNEKRQAEKISIAELQLRLAELKSKRDETQSSIELEVAKRISIYEATLRLTLQNLELVETMLSSYEIQNIDYKYGGGSTKEMLSAIQQIKSLETEINNLKIKQTTELNDIKRLVLEGKM